MSQEDEHKGPRPASTTGVSAKAAPAAPEARFVADMKREDDVTPVEVVRVADSRPEDDRTPVEEPPPDVLRASKTPSPLRPPTPVALGASSPPPLPGARRTNSPAPLGIPAQGSGPISGPHRTPSRPSIPVIPAVGSGPTAPPREAGRTPPALPVTGSGPHATSASASAASTRATPVAPRRVIEENAHLAAALLGPPPASASSAGAPSASSSSASASGGTPVPLAGTKSSTVHILPPPSMPLAPPPRSRLPVVLGVSLLLVGGVGFGAWKVLTRQPPPPIVMPVVKSVPVMTATALSKEAGIEVTSEPPGAAVWLDGAPAKGPMGETRTNLIISPVPVGKHVVEIKGSAQFKPWREEISLEEGDLARLSAVLLPVDSRVSEATATKAHRTTIIKAAYRSSSQKPAASVAAVATAPSAPSPSPDEPKPAAAASPTAVAPAPSQPEPSPSPTGIEPEKEKPVEVAAAPDRREVNLEPGQAKPPVRAALTTGMNEPPAAPKSLSTQAARQQLLIDPNDEQYKVRLTPALEHAGMNFWAVLKICVSPQGNVTDVKIVRPADPAIDSQFPSIIRKWRYRPYVVDGRPTAFCYLLRYEIDTR